MTRLSEKVNHVKRAGQTRDHHCHWPGCTKQVPPAMWGCRSHWLSLPRRIRDKIWRSYRPGQEQDGNPTEEYLAVAAEAQEWIRNKLVERADSQSVEDDHDG